MTDAETILWSRLRSWPHVRFRRQHPVGPYIADFACVPAMLVIEVDGATHGSDAERARDAVRDRYLQKRGWRVVRVWNHDVYERLDDVLDVIGHHATPSTASRSPSPASGGGKE
jgi:very-short-patch-repair endonuclease